MPDRHFRLHLPRIGSSGRRKEFEKRRYELQRRFFIKGELTQLGYHSELNELYKQFPEYDSRNRKPQNDYQNATA